MGQITDSIPDRDFCPACGKSFDGKTANRLTKEQEANLKIKFPKKRFYE